MRSSFYNVCITNSVGRTRCIEQPRNPDSLKVWKIMQNRNLRASCYRLAKLDREKFRDTVCAHRNAVKHAGTGHCLPGGGGEEKSGKKLANIYTNFSFCFCFVFFWMGARGGRLFRTKKKKKKEFLLNFVQIFPHFFFPPPPRETMTR